MIIPIWQAYRCLHPKTPTGNLYDWLFYSGSFMQRLRKHNVHPKIRVLNQNWQIPIKSEREQLDMNFRTYALVREVLILSEDKYWMYARTIFPRQTLTGDLLQLARLKNRSLGSVLFKDPALSRSEFETTLLTCGTELFDKVTKSTLLNCDELWARRSIFDLHEKKILLTEVFLPAIYSL